MFSWDVSMAEKELRLEITDSEVHTDLVLPT